MVICNDALLVLEFYSFAKNVVFIFFSPSLFYFNSLVQIMLLCLITTPPAEIGFTYLFTKDGVKLCMNKQYFIAVDNLTQYLVRQHYQTNECILDSYIHIVTLKYSIRSSKHYTVHFTRYSTSTSPLSDVLMFPLSFYIFGCAIYSWPIFKRNYILKCNYINLENLHYRTVNDGIAMPQAKNWEKIAL